MGLQENYLEYRNHINTLKTDQGYIKYILKIQQVVHQRQLVSCMSDSKWLKLLHAMTDLDFPPAFIVKLVTENRDLQAEDQFVKKIPWYLGDWHPFYHDAMPVFIAIEYLMVKPMLSKPRGRLISDLILDQTDQFRTLLQRLNIVFDEKNSCFKIYAYYSK